jgi:hypothetical protein
MGIPCLIASYVNWLRKRLLKINFLGLRFKTKRLLSTSQNRGKVNRSRRGGADADAGRGPLWSPGGGVGPLAGRPDPETRAQCGNLLVARGGVGPLARPTPNMSGREGTTTVARMQMSTTDSIHSPTSFSGAASKVRPAHSLSSPESKLHIP